MKTARSLVWCAILVTVGCVSEPERTGETVQALEDDSDDAGASCSAVEAEILLEGSEAGLSEEEAGAALLATGGGQGDCWARYALDVRVCVVLYWNSGGIAYSQCLQMAIANLVRCQLARCFGWGYGWPYRPY